jgi:hypothetical protein
MRTINRPLIIFIVIVLFVPIVVLQTIIDPQRVQFEPNLANKNKAISQLPLEFALGAATGCSGFVRMSSSIKETMTPLSQW